MLTNKTYEFRCADCNIEWTETERVGECKTCGKLCKCTARYGKCRCGRDVEFSKFTNTCECGADYNMSGQQLAPRSQWGEETGESLADILQIDAMTTEELFK